MKCKECGTVAERWKYYPTAVTFKEAREIQEEVVYLWTCPYNPNHVVK